MLVKIEGIFSILFYLAIGLVCYLLLGEYETFSWGDPWVYAYLMLWPALVVFGFFVIGAILIVLLLIIEYICYLYSKYQDKQLKKLRQRNEKLRQRNQ